MPIRLMSVPVLLLCVSFLTAAAPINQIAYSSLTGTQVITFDDVPGGAEPGTNYNAVFESGNTAFGERFVGQTLSISGNFDSLSGVPSGPLTLAIGSPGQNLNIFVHSTSQVLTGLGPPAFPDAIGEGSFALLFDFDQSEFGFQLVGGNGGSAFVNFFRRDGSLIDLITINGLAEAFYGFSRDGALKDIAGISIHNTDVAGIGFDNLRHDVAGVPDVPEPSTFALPGLSLISLVYARWRAAKSNQNASRTELTRVRATSRLRRSRAMSLSSK